MPAAREADHLTRTIPIRSTKRYTLAGVRRSVREPGKSDPIDALAVAQAVLREPNLPVASLDGPERELRLLVDHREDLIGERTRHEQRLRWFLVELAIAEPAPRSLGLAVVQAALETALAGRTEPVARFARDLLSPGPRAVCRDQGPRARDRGPRRLTGRGRSSPSPAADR